VPADLVRQLLADQHPDVAPLRTADAMKPDIQCV
jgi:hypothetical protein